MATGKKVVVMRIKFKNIHVTGMIHLHKKTGAIIYTDLLKETLQVSKLQSRKNKVENLLKQ